MLPQSSAAEAAPPVVKDPAGGLAEALRDAARQMRNPGEARAAEPRSARGPRVAVLLPCHNEAASIVRVVEEFRVALPGARIIVFDNASSDDTGWLARQA